MKYFIFSFLLFALSATAQTNLGSGYSPNSGSAAPGTFSSPTGQSNVVPPQTAQDPVLSDPSTTPMGPSANEMNTAPTPTPNLSNESDTFGSTIQTQPVDPSSTVGPGVRNESERQAQEDALDYSTTPQTNDIERDEQWSPE